ncbi:MAG TPA: hypothetical protein VGH04_00130, partial [Gemmatimonadaceae bacterium]
MNGEARKHALRFFYAKVVEPLGFTFTPDNELAEFLLDQEVTLGAPRDSVLPVPADSPRPGCSSI